MSYFGGGKNYETNMPNDYENNFSDSHNMNTSFSNLKEVDRSLNDFNTTSGPRNNDDITNIGGYGENNGEGTDGNPGLIEKKEFKELEIYDPL